MIRSPIADSIDSVCRIFDRCLGIGDLKSPDQEPKAPQKHDIRRSIPDAPVFVSFTSLRTSAGSPRVTTSTNDSEATMKRQLQTILLVLITTVLFAGCFPGGGHATPDTPAGFFTGIWHGWIAPLSLIVGLFRDGVRIYEVNNSGWWYDLGYYMAVIAGFGSISLLRKKGTKRGIMGNGEGRTKN
jgi:hypothetical protein